MPDLNDSGSTLLLPDINVAELFFTGDETLYVATKAIKADPDATPQRLSALVAIFIPMVQNLMDNPFPSP